MVKLKKISWFNASAAAIVKHGDPGTYVQIAQGFHGFDGR